MFAGCDVYTFQMIRALPAYHDYLALSSFHWQEVE